jgi:phosphoglycolate phosphatase
VPSTRVTQLVLWDIDHTLIDTNGLGTQFYVAAFETVTGRSLEHKADPTGRTEPAIFAETLERHGIEATDELQARYAIELANQYRRNLDQLHTTGHALPGAAQAIQALQDLPHIYQSVLTGNLRAVAELKLQAFGLDGVIDLEPGAYGEDANHRPDLVPIAQQRASRKLGQSFGRANTVIIGDSAGDVTAAIEGGAQFIGVATGRDSSDDLRKAGAERVYVGLNHVRELFQALER